jgi:hypothetical protein
MSQPPAALQAPHMQKVKPEIVSGHLIVDATKKRMKVRGWIIASQKASAASAPRKASARNAPAPLAHLRRSPPCSLGR